jgi:small subunit ribosomal protein S17
MFIKANSEAHFIHMAKTKEAKAAACADAHCPHHGSLKARGQTFDGIVIGDKMHKIVKVEWSFLKYFPKYQRYERRWTKVLAHTPSCIPVKAGDMVRIAECRPISKSVKFVVYEKLAGEKK